MFDEGKKYNALMWYLFLTLSNEHKKNFNIKSRISFSHTRAFIREIIEYMFYLLARRENIKGLSSSPNLCFLTWGSDTRYKHINWWRLGESSVIFMVVHSRPPFNVIVP